MKKKVAHFDRDKCVGCGACVNACLEGAVALVDGKAMLVKEDHCDGLGNCLPNCPVGAITFEEREITPAAPDACDCHSHGHEHHEHHAHHGHGSANHTCPSAQPRQLQPQAVPADVMAGLTGMAPTSMLAQWPAQIKLMPLKAPYYDGANLLVAADCTAYAYANFHAQFMRNHVTLIGCPKLDDVDYTEKLTAIIRDNNIKSVCIARMEVPCCGGLEQAVKNALQASGKFIPWQVVTISIDGHILD